MALTRTAAGYYINALVELHVHIINTVRSLPGIATTQSRPLQQRWFPYQGLEILFREHHDDAAVYISHHRYPLVYL